MANNAHTLTFLKWEKLETTPTNLFAIQFGMFFVTRVAVTPKIPTSFKKIRTAPEHKSFFFKQMKWPHPAVWE